MVGAVSDTPVRLSRFAAAHVDGGVVVVRAPGSHLAVELHPSATSLLGALAEWTTPSELAEASAEMPVASVLPLLAAAGLLAPGRPGRDEEAEQQRLAQWSVDELWLHASSRGPKTVAGYGGTYRHGRRFRPEPVLPSAFSGPRVALTVPDLAAVAHREPSLTEVLEQRRSVREHDADAPITAGQLGELLYRTVRLRQTFVGSDGQELADRPYPSGGAVHELEVYPLVTQAADLQPGLWHYATGDHTLEYVAEPGQATTALIDGARASALMDADPQVVLIVSARFGRVMWKYESVAYALILKHVGVLYQTLYLVGSAMGLAVCGLGGGDAADFADASGLDYFTEGSVGELVVGSRPRTLRSTVGVPRP